MHFTHTIQSTNIIVASPFDTGIKCPVYSVKTQDLNGCPLLYMFLANDCSRHLLFAQCMLTAVDL